MPLNPKTQAKLGELERGLLVELEPIGSSPRQRLTINMVERHIVGLVSALKQVDAQLEERLIRAIRDYLDDYEKEKAQEKEKAEAKRSRVEAVEKGASGRNKGGAKTSK